MTRRLARTRPALAASLPVALLAVLGLLTAALGLRELTYVLGAPTPLLVVLAPVLVARIQIPSGAARACAIAAIGIGLNLVIEAAASSAQIALLGLPGAL